MGVKHDYGFDARGNITSYGVPEREYTYDTARPHQVRSIANPQANGATPWTFDYPRQPDHVIAEFFWISLSHDVHPCRDQSLESGTSTKQGPIPVAHRQPGVHPQNCSCILRAFSSSFGLSLFTIGPLVISSHEPRVRAMMGRRRIAFEWGIPIVGKGLDSREVAVCRGMYGRWAFSPRSIMDPLVTVFPRLGEIARVDRRRTLCPPIEPRAS